MPAIVTALTEGNIITITSTETNYGITTTSKVVRTKKQCYVNITGPSTGLTYSIIDHKGAIIFSKEFASNGTQTEITHSINGAVTLANITTQFNTWNGGAGAAALLPEKVCVMQLSQAASGGALTYTVVRNTLGANVPLARTGAGVFTAAITSAIYDKAKASYNCGGVVAGNHLVQIGMSSDTLTVTTSVTTTGNATDNIIPAAATGTTPIAIRVQH